ncbi:MAG: DUF2147 domain-containing protein [Myxococcota bacterium]
MLVRSQLLFAGLLAMVALPQHAAAASPVGYWKTIDDDTGKPASIIQITERDGKLSGRIVQLIRQPGEEADPVCIECEGKLKGKKVVGMQILSGLEQDDDEWSGGRIMDPNNGKSYKCYIEVQDGGKKLKVRGYLGIALLGRTQYWLRVQKPDPNVRAVQLSDGKMTPIAWEKAPAE